MAETDNEGAGPGPVQTKLMEVEEAIENGTFWQQAGAILILRLTPIVPFSASNYVLGLSPLPLLPYLLGTVGGMAVWGTVYASIGGASRVLLRRGADPDVLMGSLLEKVTAVSAEAGYAAFVLGVVGAGAYFGSKYMKQHQGIGDISEKVDRVGAVEEEQLLEQVAEK